KTTLATLLVGLMLAFCLAPAQAVDRKEVEKQYGRPVLQVPEPKTPPEIDGKLDDACWNDATPVTLTHSIGAWWDPPSQKTEARVLANAKAVYVVVRCFESEPERIIESGTARNGMVVGADAVEIFLDPNHGGKPSDYFHCIVTPNGTVYRGKGLQPDPSKG